MPRLFSFEGLCTRLSVDGESIVFLSVYRPGSTRPTSQFYDELTTVLESLVVQSCPIVIGGDLNIHADKALDPYAVRLSDLLTSFDLVQHVSGQTHRSGGTLDHVVTFSDCIVKNINVEPYGVIADHGLVSCCFPSKRVSP